ncbi:glycosyltransferase family 4 protein [Paenibacillus sp. YYML68]|uniref:glycosyltransferase family 4 protein n=1 Tax=Paenibacillus sp. YYML68 TaxID=2909250 RepID=UPI002490B678|nr:glycosyltransferase [Paenibacillus sp. YYML68]
MKLLFTFYNPSGGMETLNRTRCEILQRHQIECHLLYKYEALGKQNIRNIRTFVTDSKAEITALVKRENYDAIIICTDYGLMDTIRASGYQGPIIYEVQGLGDMKTAEQILEQATASIRNNASALHYPRTPHLIQLMKRRFPAKPHFCFDNPMNLDSFGYTPYPVDRGPIVAWIGRIEVNKNWREFIEIGQRLLKTYPGLQLWMFGDMNQYEEDQQQLFDKLVSEYKLENRLIQHSNVPHALMADYLSIIGESGGFLCSTSIYEGFGYAVAEALLCRCPVLTTDSDGVRNFIIDNETGLYYKRGDLDEAAIQASRLLMNVELRGRLRMAGERLIKERFTPQKFHESFTTMLKALGVKA